MATEIELSDKRLAELLEIKDESKWGDNIKISSKNNSFKVENIDNVKLHNLVYINPPHDNKEFDDLISSIALYGQIEPVKIWVKAGTMFIIDGRHRYIALKKLGAKYIKYIEIPSNTSLDELKTMVIESENGRKMTSAQNAIRAYNDYKLNHKKTGMNMTDYASIYHTSQPLVSRCKKIDESDKVNGRYILEQLFKYKEIELGGSYLTSLNKVLAYIKELGKKPSIPKREIPIEAEPIVSAIRKLEEDINEQALAAVLVEAKRALHEVTK